MEVKRHADNTAMENENEEVELRRGPWTMEEDLILVDYISNHGEGRWNSLARSAGLKRTGKSCRLRWLNYLRPDIRRGNITSEEQLLILELHSRWGNRWSKIAEHLPGRTDNEIKNYWRTRVQKHAKQLKCDVNGKQFRDAMRYLWMPRLVERIRAVSRDSSLISPGYPILPPGQINPTTIHLNHNDMPEYSNIGAASSDSILTQVSPVSTEYCFPVGNSNEIDPAHRNDELLMYTGEEMNHSLTFGHYSENPGWFDGGSISETSWNAADILFLQQQICGGESVIN